MFEGYFQFVQKNNPERAKAFSTILSTPSLSSAAEKDNYGSLSASEKMTFHEIITNGNHGGEDQIFETIFNHCFKSTYHRIMGYDAIASYNKHTQTEEALATITMPPNQLEALIQMQRGYNIHGSLGSDKQTRPWIELSYLLYVLPPQYWYMGSSPYSAVNFS